MKFDIITVKTVHGGTNAIDFTADSAITEGLNTRTGEITLYIAGEGKEVLISDFRVTRILEKVIIGFGYIRNIYAGETKITIELRNN